MNTKLPEMLGEKYFLLDNIGTGGMANVFRAKLLGEKGFEKLIVIKKLLDHISRDQEMVDHFTNEARLAALLQHENICNIFDYGEIDGTFFIAMEHLFGKDLASIIQRLKDRDIQFAPDLILTIMSKVCDGMEYAHNLCDLQDNPLNLIHRDLTPQNIFLTYDGKVKILDFGIAKSRAFDTHTRIGIVKGKMNYMSPEQVSGDELDKRSDIFLMGILLYEMFSGIQMYHGDTGTVIRKSVQVDITPIEETAPDLPEGIHSVIKTCLQREPDERYQNCAELKNDLSHLLQKYDNSDDTSILKGFITSLFTDEFREEKESTKKLFAIQPQKKSELSFDQSIFIETGTEDNLTYAVKNETNSTVTSETEHYDMEKETDRPHIKTEKIVLGPTRPAKKNTRHAEIEIAKNAPRQSGNSYSSISIEGENKTVKRKRRRQKSREATASLGKFLPAASILVIVAAIVVVFFNYRQKHTDYFSSITPPVPPPVLDVKNMTPTTRQLQIVKLQAKGDAALQKNNLYTPEGENAWVYYAQLSQLDPSNKTAQQGIRQILVKISEEAERLITAGEKKKAAEKIIAGLAIDPENAKLLQLKMELSEK